MKKSAKLSIVSLILCFALCLSVCAVNIQTSNFALVTPNKSKISAELLSVIKSSDNNSLIPVDIWFYETETQDIESNVKLAVGVNKAEIANHHARVNYAQEIVDRYIQTERKMYREAQMIAHEDFIDKYNLSYINDTKSAPQTSGIVFASEYAPFMIAYLTANDILMLSGDDTVQSIGYSRPIEPVVPEDNVEIEAQNGGAAMSPRSDIGSQVTRSNYLRDTLGYTGSGIKIGMIEPFIPDLSYGYFSNNVQTNNCYDTGDGTNEHPTAVAAIMVGKTTVYDGVTYRGIAPDAYLYAANYLTVEMVTGNFYSQVEWLLSSGVNVINMSAGSTATTEYSSFDNWVDHIALNHSVHFVVTSGNYSHTSSYNLMAPAFSYNAIVVGSIDDKNTVNTADDVLDPESCYIESSGTNRPDLVAPGSAIAFGEFSETGTSFAAPFVTATIAQLCQARPALKTLQDAMKAILTASISHPLAFTSTIEDQSNYNMYGAGVLDARSALYTINSSRYLSASFAANVAAGTTRTYTFNVTASDTKIRISLSWLKYSTVSGAHSSNAAVGYTIADLDLIVYDPNGWEVAGSFSSVNNTEVVEFEPNTTGTYQILVTVSASSAKSIYYGLAWW